MDRERYLERPVTADLAAKMVLLAGPRQVGNTTLARRLLAACRGVYFDWDNRQHRAEIRAARWPAGAALVVLDELHKWRQWKGWLKGEFDTHRDRLRFLVTGSARMDLYRPGGDSLQGRYHHYRLHPFSVRELAAPGDGMTQEPGSELVVPDPSAREPLDAIMRFGNFPEPVLAQSERTLRRWRKERLDRFFREDVRDLQAVRDLSATQLLADLLPERVGSPLSLNALREDLEVSHRAVSAWMDLLDRLYHSFRVPPFASTRVRSLRKMSKAYLWDPSLVGAEAGRFENLVALHLLKLCHLLEDQEGHATTLCYLRDRAGHEVDFLVTVDGKPWFAVEPKLTETRADPALAYFRERLAIPWTYQVVLDSERDFMTAETRCLPAARFLTALV